jgi:hypothetical protein
VGKSRGEQESQCITQEIGKMGERSKRKNVNNEEGRKRCRRLKDEFKRVTDKAKKEYLESVEFQRT